MPGRRFEPRKRQAPSPTGEASLYSARKRRRRLNIGIDFGTSTTKVCLRERLGISDDVPFYPIALDDRGDLLCPSLVALDDGRLYFGFVADERISRPGVQAFPHLKVCMACSFERRAPLSDCAAPCDADGNCSAALTNALAAHELAALFLAWVMGEAKRRLPRDFGDVDGDFTFNIGVPVGHLEPDSSYERTYRWVGHCADVLSDRVHQGLSASEALAMIAEQRPVSPPPAEQSKVQYCPEAQAAIISYLASPEMGPGLYGLIDIGAWTTDISFFRRVQLVVSDDGILTLEYYAADSHRVAVNDVDEFVVGELRTRLDTSVAERDKSLLAAVRAQREEGTFGTVALDRARQLPPVEVLTAARNAAATRILTAFRRTLQEARTKENRISEWERKLQLFVVGGGAAETSLWMGIGPSTPVAVGISALPSSDLSHDVPSQVGPRFAVAVGLAVPSALWPRVFLPSSVPPATPPPVRRLLSFEDMGYGK